MSRKSRDKNLDIHHILPRSRGGENIKNTVLLPVPFHTNWHRLFIHMTVAEAHRFIDALMVPGKKWTYKDIERLRREIMED